MASEFPSMTCKHEAAESGMTNVEDHERQDRSDRSWHALQAQLGLHRRGTSEELCLPCRVYMRPHWDQHVQGSNLVYCKPHTFLLETPHMLLHGCKAAMLMPSVEEKMLFPAESAERSGRCAR